MPPGADRPRAASPLTAEVVADLKLALTEACSNSVRHAYPGGPGTVEISFALEPDRLVIEVLDDGEGFVPDGGADPADELSEGGLGIAIINALADEVEIGTGAGGRGSAPALRQAPGFGRYGPIRPVSCGVRLTARPPSHAAARQRRSQVAGGLRHDRDARLMDEIRRLAEPVAGKRVLHLSATAFGGGVAEILYTLVPLMADAGLAVEWRIIKGADEFYNVTKTIHNALQGNPLGLTDEQVEIFARYNALNAAELDDDYDLVIVHDPQPAAVIDHFPDSAAKWTWRGHIDFSTPNWDVFEVLFPSLRRYDAAIFHLREYVPPVSGLPPCFIWPPAIDPSPPRTWPCPRRTPRTSSTSSASTSSVRC